LVFSQPLLGLLSLSVNHRLLDAGGGTGRIAASLRGLVGEVLVEDVSRNMLRYSARKGLESICAPVEDLPFKSASFDRVIMMDALHHVSNQKRAISELWRVLIPGGRIVIIEPDIRKFAVKLIALGEKIILMGNHFLTVEGITALFIAPEARIDVRCDQFYVIIVGDKLMRI
jgi:demethylmenaquinone methyltransferase/2-methoxy-6-polyprenyl-1,4-benzoquinol methylase